MANHRLKHVVEYRTLRAVGALVSMLPYRTALAIGWVLAALAFHVGRFRVSTAKARIRGVFGSSLSKRDVGRIAWMSWRNIVFTSIELLRPTHVTRKWAAKAYDWAAFLEEAQRLVAAGKGAVFALPHMGNWDMAGALCHLHGIPIFSIAAKQKNPLVNEYISDLRAGPGVATVERGAGTMRAVLQNLRDGKMLAILPDVRVRTAGIPVDFLGGQANVGSGMALLARHAHVPIFPVIVTRRGWARHRIEIMPEVEPDPGLDKQTDTQRMTQAVMDIVDAAIRADPGQWFWFNKRWILDPLSAP